MVLIHQRELLNILNKGRIWRHQDMRKYVCKACVFGPGDILLAQIQTLSNTDTGVVVNHILKTKGTYVVLRKLMYTSYKIRINQFT